MYKDCWVDNKGIHIHFIEANADKKEEAPLVIIPGLSESAEDYIAAEQYTEKMPQANIVVFDESDHNLFEPHIDPLIQTMETFMDKCPAGK